MNENQLSILVRSQLLAGLARNSITADVIANYQPTTQGRVDGPVIYFHIIDDPQYGWQYSNSVYSVEDGVIEREESQWKRTVYQFTALSPLDPQNLSLPTPKDLLSKAAMIMMGSSFVQALMAQDVGIERITGIRNPFFVNDQGQFEASPSFDFTVTHKQTIIETAPAIESVNCTITRV